MREVRGEEKKGGGEETMRVKKGHLDRGIPTLQVEGFVALSSFISLDNQLVARTEGADPMGGAGRALDSLT